MKKRIWIGILVIGVLILGLSGCQEKENTKLPKSQQVEGEETDREKTVPTETAPTETPKAKIEVTPKYRTVTEVVDWGPVITKVILDMGVNVDGSSVDTETFLVSSYRGFQNGSQTKKRTVLACYVSDAEGKQEEEGTYITIEMEIGPDMAEASLINYNFASGYNQYVKTAYLIRVDEGAALRAKDGSDLKMKATDASCNRGNINVIADEFDCTGSYSDEISGITLTYAAYVPEHAAKGETPLVIWLHGAGEGGTDPMIAIMGNKVVNLATEKIQQYFGETGAEILVPQTPTMWMDDGEGNYMDTTDTEGGTSYYTEALMHLIETYVSEHMEIDQDRIYIGGCSNGGYMTINMLVEYPEYFAAAYPVCEAYAPAWLNDEKINALKNIPIWLTAAKTDYTVWTEDYSTALYKKLVEVKAKEIHYSLFEKVADTSGKYFQKDGRTPYEYMGHWSWIYTLNNECFDEIGGEEVSIFEWLSRQSK